MHLWRVNTIFSERKHRLRVAVKGPAGGRIGPAEVHGHISPVGQLLSGDAGCRGPAVREADGVRVADGG